LNVQHPMSKSERRLGTPMSSAVGCGIPFIVAIVAILLGFIFYRLETWPARTAHQSTAELERVGTDLKNAFIDIAHLQPRITINNRVYLEQTTPTSELSILSR